MTLSTDQVLLKRYRVVSLLAQGGMGSVYQAYDHVLERRVAIKQLQIDPLAGEHAINQTREQFQREARILASLDHPNLPRVTDHFEEAGVEYLVMDYVEGQSLSEIVENSQTGLSENQVLGWADQLLSALEYIHRHGVIHRDIKPSNIRLTPDGRVFLVDFGLVKLIDPQHLRTATIMHGLGTPEYAPPEQYDAYLGHTDPRSDIYALGATLYHLLTGEAPPTATQQMADPDCFHHPRSISPQVSRDAERAILRAMELPRARRFASAADMRSALRLAQRRAPGEMHTERLPLWANVERRLSNRRIFSIAVLALLIVGGIAGLASSGFAQPAPTKTVTPSPTAQPPSPTATAFGPLVITSTTSTAASPTSTRTSTPTASSTSTATATPTFTPTSTSTRRPTLTPTATNTPLPTATLTVKPPAQRSPTPITPSPTPRPPDTDTPTPRPPDTDTPTPRPTPTRGLPPTWTPEPSATP